MFSRYCQRRLLVAALAAVIFSTLCYGRVVKLGFIPPDYDPSVNASVHMALDMVNKNNVLRDGDTFELVYAVGHACFGIHTAPRATTVRAQSGSGIAQQFVSAGVVAIVGPPCSESVVEIGPHLGDIPLVSYAASASALTSDLYPNFFRTNPTDAEQDRVFVSLILGLGVQHIAIIYTDDTYGRSGSSQLIDELAERAPEVYVAKHLPIAAGATIPDAEGILQQIKDELVHVILIFSEKTVTRTVLLAGVNRDMGPMQGFQYLLTADTAAAGSGLWDEPGLLSVRPAAQTALMPSVMIAESERRLTLSVTMGLMGLPVPTSYGMFAYDALWALAKGIAHDKVIGNAIPTPSTLRLALNDISFTGVSGHVELSPDPHAHRANFEILNIRDNSLTQVGTQRFFGPLEFHRKSVHWAGGYDGAVTAKRFLIAQWFEGIVSQPGGAKIAADEINRNNLIGGYDLIILDDAFHVDFSAMGVRCALGTAREHAAKLLNQSVVLQKPITSVIGSECSQMVDGINQEFAAQGAEIPNVAWGGWTGLMNTTAFPMLMGLKASRIARAKSRSRIVQHFGQSRLAFIVGDVFYDPDLPFEKQFIQDLLNDAGATVSVAGTWSDETLVETIEEFEAIQSQKRNIIEKIREENVKVIMAYLPNRGEMVDFALKMYEAGLYGAGYVFMFATSPRETHAKSPEDWAKVSQVIRGSFTTIDESDIDPPPPRYTALKQSWTDRGLAHDVDYFAAVAFDAVHLTAQGISKCKAHNEPPSGASLMRRMRELDIEGATQTRLVWEQNGDIEYRNTVVFTDTVWMGIIQLVGDGSTVKRGRVSSEGDVATVVWLDPPLFDGQVTVPPLASNAGVKGTPPVLGPISVRSYTTDYTPCPRGTWAPKDAPSCTQCDDGALCPFAAPIALPDTIKDVLVPANETKLIPHPKQAIASRPEANTTGNYSILGVMCGLCFVIVITTLIGLRFGTDHMRDKILEVLDDPCDLLDREPPRPLITTPVGDEVLEHQTPFGGLATICAWIGIMSMMAYVILDAANNAFMLNKNTELGSFNFDGMIDPDAPRPPVFHAMFTFIALDFPNVCVCHDGTDPNTMINVTLLDAETPMEMTCKKLPDISGCQINVTVWSTPGVLLPLFFGVDVRLPQARAHAISYRIESRNFSKTMAWTGGPYVTTGIIESPENTVLFGKSSSLGILLQPTKFETPFDHVEVEAGYIPLLGTLELGGRVGVDDYFSFGGGVGVTMQLQWLLQVDTFAVVRNANSNPVAVLSQIAALLGAILGFVALGVHGVEKLLDKITIKWPHLRRNHNLIATFFFGEVMAQNIPSSLKRVKSELLTSLGGRSGGGTPANVDATTPRTRRMFSAYTRTGDGDANNETKRNEAMSGEQIELATIAPGSVNSPPYANENGGTEVSSSHNGFDSHTIDIPSRSFDAASTLHTSSLPTAPPATNPMVANNASPSVTQSGVGPMSSPIPVDFPPPGPQSRRKRSSLPSLPGVMRTPRFQPGQTIADGPDSLTVDQPHKNTSAERLGRSSRNTRHRQGDGVGDRRGSSSSSSSTESSWGSSSFKQHDFDHQQPHDQHHGGGTSSHRRHRSSRSISRSPRPSTHTGERRTSPREDSHTHVRRQRRSHGQRRGGSSGGSDGSSSGGDHKDRRSMSHGSSSGHEDAGDVEGRRVVGVDTQVYVNVGDDNVDTLIPAPSHNHNNNTHNRSNNAVAVPIEGSNWVPSASDTDF